MNTKQGRVQSLYSTNSKLSIQTREKLQKLLKSLLLNKLSQEFRDPVPWEQLGLNNYLSIVKKPIDLNSITRNIIQARYLSVQSCLDDIQLIFGNCRLYNKDNFWILDLADKCQKVFFKLVTNYFPDIKRKQIFEKKRQKLKKRQLKPLKTLKDKIKQNENEQTRQVQIQSSSPNQEFEKQNEVIIVQSVNQGLKKKCEELLFFIPTLNFQQVSTIYLMVKNQCIQAISIDKYGNSDIDIEKLSANLIDSILDFIKFDINQETKILKPEKKYIQKFRYSI